MARLRDNRPEVSSLTSWPWYWAGEKPGSAGVPQLKRWPRQSPGIHRPPHPPWQLQYTQTYRPAASLGWARLQGPEPNQHSCREGNFGPREPVLAPTPSVKTENQARGSGAGHGCCLPRLLQPWDSPGCIEGHGKAWRELGGLRPGLVTLPSGLMAGATQSNVKPQHSLRPRLERVSWLLDSQSYSKDSVAPISHCGCEGQTNINIMQVEGKPEDSGSLPTAGLFLSGKGNAVF